MPAPRRDGSVWRRRTIAFSGLTACALAAALVVPEEARTPGRPPRCPANPELVEEIHPDLLYRGSALPPDENAYGLLARAAASLSALPDGIEAHVSDRAVHGRARDALRSYLEDNVGPMRLLDEALERGRIQFPARGELVALVPFRRLAFARMARGASRLAAGDGAGVNDLHDAWRYSTMWIEGDGLFMHFQAALSLEAGVLRSMRWYSGRDDADEAALPMFLDDVRRERSAVRRAADRVLAAEFTCWGLVEIDAFGREIERNPFGCATGANPLCGERFLQAIAGHPAPFDPVGTVRELAGQLARVLRWPGDGEPPAFELSGHEARLLAIFASRADATDAERREEHAAVMAMPNPLGTILRERMRERYVALHGSFRKGETERALTVAVLGARLFEMRHGRLPESLDEMVRSGILDETPRDPYRGDALRYSAAARAVWSVGEDRSDDGGALRKCQREGTPPDVVRSIPDPLDGRREIGPHGRASEPCTERS